MKSTTAAHAGLKLEHMPGAAAAMILRCIAGSSDSPDTGGSILGSTPASSRTRGIAAAGKSAAAEGTRTAAAGAGAAAAGTGTASSAPAAISNSGDVVPGSTAKEVGLPLQPYHAICSRRS